MSICRFSLDGFAASISDSAFKIKASSCCFISKFCLNNDYVSACGSAGFISVGKRVGGFRSDCEWQIALCLFAVLG